jgi:ABC-type dipeptide/oligopeptide/nickel transport system permease subunit/ABC-type dipeptide/oligopeptide/nickel transport system permease component
VQQRRRRLPPRRPGRPPRRRLALRRPGRPRRRRPPRPPAGWTYLGLLAGLILALALVAGLAAPALVKLLGLTGPLVREPHALNLFGNPTGPSARHPLGVDSAGRDVLSRILYGLRSLELLSLAGTGCAALAGAALAVLVRTNRWVGWVIARGLGALSAFPPVLLGLGVGLAVGPGVGRLIIPLALVALVIAHDGHDGTTPDSPRRTAPDGAGGTAPDHPRRTAPDGAGGTAPDRQPAGWRGARRWPAALAPRWMTMFAGAAALDFALTFLGDGPGGHSPQLGAMVAQAGRGILAGVPAWWVLLFPGLAGLVVVAAAGLTGPRSPRAPAAVAPRRLWAPTLRGYLADRVTVALAEAGGVIGLAALMFRSLGGRDPGGHPALAGFGAAVPATLSLLLGGAVVWLSATFLQLALGTRAHLRRRRGPGGLAQLPARLVGAAPAGWLGFLALYLFSDSVGKLPVLPGAHTYVGLTSAPGRWAQSLLIPWLLLGLALAARTAPALGTAIDAGVRSGQQRVARAAGVPEVRLARQRRRALVAPLLELVRADLPTLLSLSVSIEFAFAISGLGTLSIGHARLTGAATLADLATLYALAVVVARLGFDLGRVRLDPQVVSPAAPSRAARAMPTPEPAAPA